MSRKETPQSWFLEIALVLISLALCWLLCLIGAYRMVVLHLFYLPVVLAAFFLGRYRAGVLALLGAGRGGGHHAGCQHADQLRFTRGGVAGVGVWSADWVLTAILAGTLSDERTAKIAELHDAYVGVVEVLSRYLSSADPATNDQTVRVSLLSQKVAARMGLSNDEVNNIRVAALLQDINHIEVTAKVIQKAVGDLQQASRPNTEQYTFHGSDLVCSLGGVLTGAWRLLLSHGDGLDLAGPGESSGPAAQRSAPALSAPSSVTSRWPMPSRTSSRQPRRSRPWATTWKATTTRPSSALESIVLRAARPPRRGGA